MKIKDKKKHNNILLLVFFAPSLIPFHLNVNVEEPVYQVATRLFAVKYIYFFPTLHLFFNLIIVLDNDDVHVFVGE